MGAMPSGSAACDGRSFSSLSACIIQTTFNIGKTLCAFVIIDVIHLANPVLAASFYRWLFGHSPAVWRKLGVCGPVLLLTLIHVWTVYRLSMHVRNRSPDEPLMPGQNRAVN